MLPEVVEAVVEEDDATAPESQSSPLASKRLLIEVAAALQMLLHQQGKGVL